MVRWLVCLLFLGLVEMPVSAAPFLSALSLRELAYQAETIVVAAPVDARQPERWKVLQHLKGPPLTMGEELQVAGLAPYHRPNEEPVLGQVHQAVLFLLPDKGGRAPATPEKRFLLVSTGVRYMTRDSQVWRPLPDIPGQFRLFVFPSATWTGLLQQLQEDVAEVNRLQFVRDLPPGSRRNRALLDWVERHRLEFQPRRPSLQSLPVWPGSPVLAPPSQALTLQERKEEGWGDLEQLPFNWVLDSGSLPDCWRAVQLYAEIHGGETLGLNHVAFGTKAGRQFLVQVALDERQLDGCRRRVLRLLASPRTLRVGGQQPSGLPLVPLDKAEQLELLDRLSPLLQSKSAALRGQTAWTLLEISRSLDKQAEEFTRRALPALEKAYQAEKPGRAREDLAEAVRSIGGEERWQKLTNQKYLLAAFFQDVGTRDDHLFFWMYVRSNGQRVHERPSLLLERLDAGGKVLEKKTMPLPTVNLPVPNLWVTGWDGSFPLYAELPVAGLELGTWRMRVEGEAGNDKAHWASEPRIFQVVSAEKPGELRPVNPPVPVKRVPVVPVED